jgi:hypothetical protein
MKNQYLSIIFLLPIFIFSCNSQKKSNEVASYKYEEKKVEMSAELRSKTPEWVVEGKVCYGLIVQTKKDKNKNEIPVFGKPIKAKVVQIKEDAIIMKALERVSLVEVENCTKQRLDKGDTWEEKDGDFFLTKQAAISALKANNLYKNDDRVTVD